MFLNSAYLDLFEQQILMTWRAKVGYGFSGWAACVFAAMGAAWFSGYLGWITTLRGDLRNCVTDPLLRRPAV